MTKFPTCPFGTTISAQDIITEFTNKSVWEERYRQLILWGKQLPAMPESLRNDSMMVKGCESEVYLQSMCEQGTWWFSADSDARIVKGLIAVVMSAVNGKTTQEIIAFDMQGYFSELGLIEHLSPSRGNGLKAIVDHIEQIIR